MPTNTPKPILLKDYLFKGKNTNIVIEGPRLCGKTTFANDLVPKNCTRITSFEHLVKVVHGQTPDASPLCIMIDDFQWDELKQAYVKKLMSNPEFYNVSIIIVTQADVDFKRDHTFTHIGNYVFEETTQYIVP